MSRTSGEGGLEPVFIAPASSPHSPLPFLPALSSPAHQPTSSSKSRPNNQRGQKKRPHRKAISTSANSEKAVKNKNQDKNQNQNKKNSERDSSRPAPIKKVNRGDTKRFEEVSAGGLVVNKKGESGLLIGRIDKRGKVLWSLPKGHIEIGESPEEAAIREVREETGIKSSITRSLGVIDFWFMAEGKRIHKTVHHFLFTENSGKLEPQISEVDDVKWFPLEEIAKILAYPDERKLIQRSGDLKS